MPFVGRWGNLATEQEFVTSCAAALMSRRLFRHVHAKFQRSRAARKKAKDIYAYIRTFKSSAPPLKDIPTLNAIVEAAK